MCQCTIAGILLSREGSAVWLFNQSPVDVFVSSPTLHTEADVIARVEKPNVVKIESGRAVEIFDFEWAQRIEESYSNDARRRAGPHDIFAAHVSFYKGWGKNYKRQDVYDCPCWIQLKLNPR